MKFCHICGRPLQDNEVCNCQSQQPTVDASYQQTAAPQPQQTAVPGAQPPYQQQPYQQQPYQQQPYQQQYYQGQPPYQPKPEGRFVKSLKNIPVVFKSFWTSGNQLEDNMKKGKDWILPLLFIAIFFLVNLILGICYFARMTDTTYHYHEGLGMFAGTFAASGPFKFGFVLLSALIMTVFTSCIYINFRFLSSLILSKKKPADAFMDALIEFGLHAMPISLWLFLGALLSLATCWLTVPFVGFAMAYYVVIGVSNTLKESAAYKNVFLRNVIIAGFVMLAIALITWMLFLCCRMNIGGYSSGIVYY